MASSAYNALKTRVATNTARRWSANTCVPSSGHEPAVHLTDVAEQRLTVVLQYESKVLVVGQVLPHGGLQLLEVSLPVHRGRLMCACVT